MLLHNTSRTKLLEMFPFIDIVKNTTYGEGMNYLYYICAQHKQWVKSINNAQNHSQYHFSVGNQVWVMN